jgi:Ca2+-binding RTX toxin-like protein
VKPLKLMLALTAALAASLALTSAPAEAAASSASINGKTATLNLDRSDDNETVSVSGGLLVHTATAGGLNGPADWDSATPGDQTVPADGTFEVAVDGSDGNDSITVLAKTTEITGAFLSGGAGDDVVTGADTNDSLDGGDGNDRLIGAKGADKMNGGAGNDTLVWNNGDASDTISGDAGNDTTEVNGSSTLGDVFTLDANAGRIKFQRTNLVPFTLDASTERFQVDGLGGNDSLSATDGVGALTLLSVDGGAGDDTVTGSDGSDLLVGGEGNDVLSGGGGDDRIVGDRGGDTMNGGAADDTLVWNNGDGNDVMNGEDGVDRIEDNLGAGNDVSTLKVEGGRVRYDRTSAGAFNLSVATAEVFELNTLGGDDSLTSTPGLPITVVADGGAGNDTLNVRDAVASFVFGGSGTDTAIADAQTVDAVAADVETVDRPAIVTPPAAGTVTLAKTAKVKKGTATLKLSCPAGTTGCNGSVTLLTTKSLKAGKLKAALVLGRKSYALKAGETKSIKVKLASGTANLAKKKKLTVSARVFSQGAVERSAKVRLSF